MKSFIRKIIYSTSFGVLFFSLLLAGCATVKKIETKSKKQKNKASQKNLKGISVKSVLFELSNPDIKITNDSTDIVLKSAKDANTNEIKKVRAVYHLTPNQNPSPVYKQFIWDEIEKLGYLIVHIKTVSDSVIISKNLASISFSKTSTSLSNKKKVTHLIAEVENFNNTLYTLKFHDEIKHKEVSKNYYVFTKRLDESKKDDSKTQKLKAKVIQTNNYSLLIISLPSKISKKQLFFKHKVNGKYIDFFWKTKSK